jgi:hypothetical protein
MGFSRLLLAESLSLLLPDDEVYLPAKGAE